MQLAEAPDDAARLDLIRQAVLRPGDLERSSPAVGTRAPTLSSPRSRAGCSTPQGALPCRWRLREPPTRRPDGAWRLRGGTAAPSWIGTRTVRGGGRCAALCPKTATAGGAGAATAAPRRGTPIGPGVLGRLPRDPRRRALERGSAWPAPPGGRAGRGSGGLSDLPPRLADVRGPPGAAGGDLWALRAGRGAPGGAALSPTAGQGPAAPEEPESRR